MNEPGTGNWGSLEWVKWFVENIDGVEKFRKLCRGWFQSFEGESAEPDKVGEILILGPGGVGKTTFAKIIAAASHPVLDARGSYEESIRIEHFAFGTDDAVEIVVLPGQEHRRKSTWEDELQRIADGQYSGVMLFSSYGMHSLGEISYKHTDVYQPRMSSKAFVKEFSEKQRKEEIAVLESIQPYIIACPSRLWLNSVVTKEDLWWPQREGVKDNRRK